MVELVTYKNNLEALLTPTIPYVFSEHTWGETEQLARDMIALMYKRNGLGLSANQCGLPWSVFVMRGMPADIACFNPRIAMYSDEIIKLEEGCLSFPNLLLPIERPKHGRVRFAGPNGEVSSHTFTGMTFRIFQHEMSHLEGKMFFEGCNRLHLERAIRHAKKHGNDYSGMRFMKYCRR